MKIYDKVEQWAITIEGVDKFGDRLVGARAVITKEVLEEAIQPINFPINELEFKLLWKKIMVKAKETDANE